MLLANARGQVIAEFVEEFALAFEIILPTLPVNRHQTVEIALRNLEPSIESLWFRDVPDRRFLCVTASLAPLDNPSEHT